MSAKKKTSDKAKTKQQLIDEMEKLRCQIAELETTADEETRVTEEQTCIAKELGLPDITESKKVETQLRRLATLVINLTDAIIVQDFEGQIITWNHSAEQMYGYSTEEALRMNIAVLTPPHKIAEQVEFTRRLIAGEAIHSFETQRLTKDGRILDIWLTVTILADELRRPIGIASTERDITDRKWAAERIEHLNAILRAIRNINQIITIASDRERLCQAVCESLTETRGYHQSWIVLLDDKGKPVQSAKAKISDELTQLIMRINAGDMPACAKKALQTGDLIVLIGKMESDCQGCPLFGKYGDQEAMTISLNHREKCYGLLSVLLPPGFRSDEEEHDLFKEMASDISHALHGIDEEKQRQHAEMMLALRIRIASIFLMLPNEDMYHNILNLVLEVMESPLGTFGFIDTSGDLVVPTMTRHVWDQCQVPQKTIRFTRKTWGDSTWPKAIREKRIICVNAPSVNVPEGHIPISRHISLPIIFQDTAIGLFQVANKETDYTKDDIELLKMIAEQIAPILNIRLQQEKAEESLRLSEEKYRNMIHDLSEAFYVITPEGTLLDHNHEFNRIFGFDPEENLVGIQLPDFWQNPEDRQSYLQAFTKDRVIRNYIIDAKKKNGEKIVVRASARLVENEQGNTIRIEGTFMDVTREKIVEKTLKKYTRELERSNRELEDFAYVASHDLQEPLRMVSSYTQLLARRYQGQLDQDADEFIHYAVDGANRMQQLIEALLSYSRISTKGQQFQPTNLQTVLGQVHSNLKMMIEETNALITKGDLPTVLADENQMVQLFQNLIGNAIKYHGSNTPAIHISAERKGNGWMISVSDNGIGIDPKYNKRIFTIFEQLHKKGEYAGTGIGLAICKRIVERHGGRIWVKSRPDKGSTFHFTLPTEGIKQ